jgi:hypothetical protein
MAFLFEWCRLSFVVEGEVVVCRIWAIGLILKSSQYHSATVGAVGTRLNNRNYYWGEDCIENLNTGIHISYHLLAVLMIPRTTLLIRTIFYSLLELNNNLFKHTCFAIYRLKPFKLKRMVVAESILSEFVSIESVGLLSKICCRRRRALSGLNRLKGSFCGQKVRKTLCLHY